MDSFNGIKICILKPLISLSGEQLGNRNNYHLSFTWTSWCILPPGHCFLLLKNFNFWLTFFFFSPVSLLLLFLVTKYSCLASTDLSCTLHQSILCSLSRSCQYQAPLLRPPPSFFLKFYWSIVDIKCCSIFCCATKWLS